MYKRSGSRQMPVTLLVIAANILVYALTVMAGMNLWWGNGEQLLHWGANYWPLTIGHGEYWRLLTSMFLHAGWWHLLTNMLGLFIAGVFLEPVIRPLRFIIAYLVTGLIADYASVLFHRNMVGVGASGAIFGIYGVFFALLTTRLFPPIARHNFLGYISLFILLNLLVAGFSQDIDNAAHLTGFLSGMLMGYVLYFTLTPADGLRLPHR
ncbi:rhomboid family intramembrane serine protease [Chitinophaga oryzae]|uniref:Rhomboid family intramembrane serine protease n=1 Tax=Chitinophaga oryzae TaxID=2725414 RepID=A0AAE6ZMG4_9BACT|nr:rhomboid family intramembrane serine protease [Chitinophaga oryzae]QJB35277.1 rhomboid family intramembrane serine protease [Chitinophaga oryzae]QJB41812.1 rhomboid family intramembrane serine protease [Chitinophaga oryzae]